MGMSMVNISKKEIAIVKDILDKHIKNGEVLIFGSRYKGTNGLYSDLDIAIKIDGGMRIKDYMLIREAFEESELPFRVDVMDYYNMSCGFRRIVDEGHEVV